MSKSRTFAEGIYYNEPRQGAPEFVVGSLTLDVERLTAWMESCVGEDGKVRVDLLRSQKDPTRIYGSLNDYKPKPRTEDSRRRQRSDEGDVDANDDVPF